MKIIHPAINIAEIHLGNQCFVNYTNEYRMIKYCILKETKDGMLLYHTVTKEMVFLNDKEITDLQNDMLKLRKQEVSDFTFNENFTELVKHWFLVPYDFDDKVFSDKFKIDMNALRTQKNITQYLIFTTTDCNAHCYYCFENKDVIYMDKSVGDSAILFIVSNYKQQEIVLKWFGGEPLLNYSIITYICSKLLDLGILFKSYIITNGYLFNDEIINIARKVWNLEHVQISMDGTYRYYNKCKGYDKVEDDNPFNQVIENIKRLIECDIYVSVRLNLGIDNYEELCSLVLLLKEEIPIRTHLKFTIGLLNGIYKEKNIDLRYNHYAEFNQLAIFLEKMGFSTAQHLKRGIYFNKCMADSDDSITILPDGSLGKCEYYTNKFTVGHVLSPHIIKSEIEKWKEISEYGELCINCPLYPECVLLKRCPTKLLPCDFIEQKSLIKQKQRDMMKTYRHFENK